MAGKIFLINNKQLVEMNEQFYESEDLLQSLLADYPDLLAGEQIDSFEPRRWILISREVAVPDEEAGSRRWDLDHLFLDQDAIPTLVEVKRSTDTRIRREVIGQMLDYAANAVVYWQVDKLRAEFELDCQQQNIDPSELLIAKLGVENQDEFWQKVKTNLLAGKVRLVFVADQIPNELQRIIEFLNKQMNPAEVLALEVKQFAGEGQKVLVPKVIGYTGEAQQAKKGAGTTGKKWDALSFFQELESRQSHIEMEIAQRILHWAEQKKLRIWWGLGSKQGSFIPVFDRKNKSHYLFGVWTYGRIEIQFQYMPAPFDLAGRRSELHSLLTNTLGVDIPETSITKRPTFPLSFLNTEEKLTQFLEIWDWYIQEIENTED